VNDWHLSWLREADYRSRALNIGVSAAVTDVNRQVVAGRKSFSIHPAQFYIGLQGPPGFDAPALEVKLHAEWLVCKDVCIPEGGDFALLALDTGTHLLEVRRRIVRAEHEQHDADGGTDSKAKVPGLAFELL